MLLPALPPGVKKRNNFSGQGVRSSDVTPFVSIAEQTRERQVAQCGGTSVLAGDNVIELIADVAVVLVDQTVLAPSSGPAAHLLSQSC